MVLKVGKFSIDNFWSLERFILSILSLAILNFLNKVLHIVLMYGSFSKQLIRPNLLIKIFRKPLPYGKYAVCIKLNPSFFRKSAHSVNILVLFGKFCQNFHYNFVFLIDAICSKHFWLCLNSLVVYNTKL
jgi:hypothetical protein